MWNYRWIGNLDQEKGSLSIDCQPLNFAGESLFTGDIIMAHILVVDDEKKMRHLLAIILTRRGYKVDQAGDGMEAMEMIKTTPFDIVIADIKMPRMDGTMLLKKIGDMDIPSPVVFVTAFATVESAVDAMRQGAADYITKPFDEERILLAVERTLNLSRVLAENRELRQELQKATGSGEIVYRSKKMSELMDITSRVAESDSTVLISGESGTGKELQANFIHRASQRRNGRFVPVNCAAISPNLVESELFGHEKGAFTGAIQKAVGKFGYASGGTLFLDEIGDLNLDVQAKLLRALQEKKVQRVGENEEIPVDVRVVCATNQNLDKLVEKGDFRQDLFFRINVFPIHLPPLRERMDDIIPLAGYFLSRLGGEAKIQLTNGAMRVLKEYTWPGNVRELANVMERAVLLGRDQRGITVETLSFLKTPSTKNAGSFDFKLLPEGLSLEELERNFVRQALDISNNNQTAAARLLRLTRAKFRVLMRQTGK